MTLHRSAAVASIFAALLGATQCQKNIARPPVEEVPIRDPSEARFPPAATSTSAKLAKSDRPEPSATAVTAALPSPYEDAPEPPRDKAFPKQADSCKKDLDCAATNLALGGDSVCCSPCKPVAGTKAWVKRVEQVCQQKMKNGQKPKCEKSECAKAEAECRSGKCVLK